MAARKTLKATVPKKPKAAAVKKTGEKTIKKAPFAESRTPRVVKQDMCKDNQPTDNPELELQSEASNDSAAALVGEKHACADMNRVQEIITDDVTPQLESCTVAGEDNCAAVEMDEEQAISPLDDQQNQQADENDVQYEEEKIAAFRLFVSKLAYEATREDLEDYFSQFGVLIDIHIPRQPGNPALNKGYGFVSFENEGDLLKVLEAPSHVILGRDVMIDRATGQKYHSSTKAMDDTSTRYRDIYPRYKRQYDEKDLRLDRYYRKEREDHYRYSYYGSDRGSYASPVSYSRTYSGFDPHKPVSYVFSGSSKPEHYGDIEYDNRYNTRASLPPKTRPRTVPKLFIGRLGPETTVGTMRNYFSQFGEIADAYIPRDSYTQKSKGFGFLTFAHKDALHAVMEPNAKHYIDGKEVVVDYADTSTRRN
ncbi:RNA recognition motif. (a.k.a. RRM, RBD, or RNP) domain containing protein, putative [Babesia bigemina]|uniref:RNA recognition motif. (A.k.a. RRM, RBD, or RNP) domain containing protein, putative n=1 Tax=Babesia bigemina TaxID=5866 RepID=A0A061DD05_BABBI|nr:RNA recognition motif. (a.k.a. RRM, RBD, or RNP) domain containing protein, putative [Babesia bigemina]CDR98112.1 RNA recognition motif. (a.k.a. RRM, RBD, or RNP) domain containing protein, putative [Babesia bigemina]|eukprot:XP_012770298.1 RNA recognition motif. (a.k.a. RRM, RBD, or RNP) domain containing protein, putative [Babesia bigemina]